MSQMLFLFKQQARQFSEKSKAGATRGRRVTGPRKAAGRSAEENPSNTTPVFGIRTGVCFCLPYLALHGRMSFIFSPEKESQMGRSIHFLPILMFTVQSVIAVIPVTGHTAWSNDPAVNTPIAATEGNDWHPKILSDSHGGAIITWEKDGTIYVQRVDANGNLLWKVNGVPVSLGGHGLLPQIASDVAGGAIITWLEDQTGIYAQRLDANGNLLWGEEGVTISEAGRPLIISPAIVSDGSGGAIIAWMDGRSGNYGLYAQLVNSTGSVQWISNGVAVTDLTPVCQSPVGAVSDGVHGAIISWSDCHNGDSNADVYAQRINAGGAVQWGAHGSAICNAANSQVLSDAESDGNGGTVITWSDQRTLVNSYDIYAQKVNADGFAQWAVNGVGVCTAAEMQSLPVLAGDGSGGAFIAWVDNRSVPASVYAQRLNTNGTPQWTSNGTVISDHTFSNAGGLNMADGGNDSAIIGWLDGHNGNGQGFLYAQKIGINGVGQWTAGGVAVSTPAIWSVFDIGLVNDGSGGAIFTWYDQRNFPVTNNDIYAQKILSSGTLPAGAPSVTTAGISNITSTTATGGGTVTFGGAAVTARGVCWGTSANPTISGSHTSNGTGIGPFTSVITGLSPYTTYHVRAYAVNSAGTGYGDDDYFTTLCPSYVAKIGTTDYDTLQGSISTSVGTVQIRAVAKVLTEVLNISGNKSITLLGGYDCVCGAVTGVTTVHGSITVGGEAAVTMNNIAVY
jgi:hypothetical protein